MRKAVFALALFSSLSFGLNTVEYRECYKYNCSVYWDNPPKTYVWTDGVEVWVASDFPDENIPIVERTVKMFNAVANVNLIFKGKSNLPSSHFIDRQTCEPNYGNIADFEGIIFISIPYNCSQNFGHNYGFTFQVGLIETTVPPPIKAGSVIAIYESPDALISQNLLIYIHELGHALGFVHVEDVGLDPNSVISIMSWSVPITQEDVDVLQYFYGQPTQAEPMEVFEYHISKDSFISETQNGICVAGGIYPYTPMVVSGNCELRPIKGASVNCWEVHGNIGETCTVKVVDKDNNSAEYTITVQGFNFVGDTPVDGGAVSESGGGGGGCNTASELGVLGLLAVLGRFLRRFFP